MSPSTTINSSQNQGQSTVSCDATVHNNGVEHKKEEEIVKQYHSSLDCILKLAQDEYKMITYDRRNRQNRILKDYMWFSTLIIGVETSCFMHVFNTNVGFSLPWTAKTTILFYIFASLSFLCSSGVFILGIDTLRGKGNTYPPVNFSYIQLMNMVYDDFYNKDLVIKSTFRSTCINALAETIDKHRIAAGKVGVRLRIISWSLLSSLLFFIFAMIATI